MPRRRLRRTYRRLAETLPGDLAAPAIRLCRLLQVQPQLPRPDEWVLVTEGVLAGKPFTGVSCPPENGATGWLFTATDYTGDWFPEDLLNTHAIHYFEERPAIATLLALPPGWWFRFADGRPSRLWFDAELAATLLERASEDQS